MSVIFYAVRFSSLGFCLGSSFKLLLFFATRKFSLYHNSDGKLYDRFAYHNISMDFVTQFRKVVCFLTIQLAYDLGFCLSNDFV